DVSSPSNVVNTSAFFHPLRMPTKGAPMVELQWKGESLGIHALYIPRQPLATLPSPDSRWLPRNMLTNYTSSIGEVYLPEVLEYNYLSELELNHARDHNYGLRLTSHR